MGLSVLNIDPGDSSVHSGKNAHGENQSGNRWAVRTIVKKGEDRFLICEDLRALFIDDEEEVLVLPAPKPGSIAATFTVFDGHVDNSASSFCEQRWLEHLKLAVEKQTKFGNDLSVHGSARRKERTMNNAINTSSDGKNSNNNEIIHDLESVLSEAVSSMETAYKESNRGAGGCFGGCFGNPQGNFPKGGSTMCSILIQRGVTDDEDDAKNASFYIVCANVGDSSSLMLPHPDDKDEFAEGDGKYQRLAREHSPDDPLEAQRLVSAGYRLARMSNNRSGKEAGPLRMYPGGYAVSRAIGNFMRKDAIISEPECTRVKLPRNGARILVASDGVFAALNDSEIAKICSKHKLATDCVDAVMDRVLEKRGRHDDITLIVCDVPKPEEYLKAFRMNVGTSDTLKVYTRVCAPKGLKGSSKSSREEEDQIPEFVEGDITVHEGGVFDEQYEKTIFNDYEFGDLLGRGVYGSVRLAKAKVNDTGEDFAIKSVVNSVDYAHQIRNEIETLRVLSGKHPNLPTLVAVYEDKSKKLFGGGIIYLVTDVCKGSSLFDSISKRKVFDERDWRLVATQLLSAVSFMHSLGVVHRDIKPDNIMCKNEWTVDSEPHLQIIDFGSASFCKKHEKLRGYHGTKFFASPEMCNKGLYDEKTDNWAVGVVLIVLLTGYPEGEQVQETWQKLLRGILPESLIETTPNDKFIELIKMCLTIDYEKRPSCAAILKACEKWLHDPDDKKKKKTSDSSNKALLISKSVLAAEYEKHVANLLSVCASANVVSKILSVVKIIQKSRSQREKDGDESDTDASVLYDSYILAEDLEDAARRVKANDVAMQLESLRHLHGSSALTIDLEKLKELESLHRRHDHVFKAIKEASSSESKVSEFTQMREDRDVVQSTVHGEMLYAMLYAKSNDNSVRGSSVHNSGTGKDEKSDWVQEPLHDEVRVTRRSSYVELEGLGGG
jgi:serine/threonine protein kinase/serine/threonine protein phosphatase PrpC